MEVLGIDVGGVILASANDNTDTSFFGGNYLHSKPEPYMFESIARLIAERFGDNVYIVSKCGKNTQRKTLEWFNHNRFYEKTGLLRGHEYFTLTREGKAPICAELGITHFIDDRLDVLRHLSTVQNKILFRGHDREMSKYAYLLPTVHHVHSWPEVTTELLT